MRCAKRRIIYNPLSFQREFHRSTNSKVYLSGGYGCGKSYSLCMKLFALMDLNKGHPGGILCPTLKMFKRDVLPTIKQICEDNSIPYHFNKTDQIFEFPDTKSTVYVFHGEDDGASIRGPNLAFMAINEVTLISKATFDAALARVRVKGARCLQVAASGTPEGFNWAYEYFIEHPRTDTDLIFGNTRENKHLADSYVQTLEDSYDALMREQFIDGKFVNLTGKRSAWSFDRFKHVKQGIERIPGAPVWVSLDFNLNPMAATLWNRMPIDSIHKLQAFADIKLNTSNTYEMAQVIKEQVGCQVIIYPDPAGASGSTKSAGKSDIQILRDAGFHDIKYKKSITSVRDCLNAMNNLFDKNQVIIGAQCKNLIADLEQCTMKDNGQIDKSNSARSHWLDGFKDMVDYEFPIMSANVRAQILRG